MEFQKCLDATDPVPYSKILAIVKEEVRMIKILAV